VFCVQIDRILGGSTAVARYPGPEQPVASTRDRLQQFSIRTERLANSGDMSLQRILFEALPDAVDELILGDELARRLDQDLDNLKRASADRDGFSPCAKFASA
jgi:hypothetical protein